MTHRSDAGEARTRGLSVSSQALYRWVTAFPLYHSKKISAFYTKYRWQRTATDLGVTLQLL